MAYTAPDASDLKARYPAFAAVDDATVDVWLADAAQDCVAFPEDYRARAEMAYAAHLEFGTSKMAARPYMRPARDKKAPKIRRLFAQEIEKLVRKA